MTLTLDRPLDLTPGIVDDATRRQFIAGGLAAGALLVTGCGESDPSAGAPAGSTDDDFPVTITHVYGTTTIAEKPERVVTVGATDTDYVLALGVPPVGTVTNLGAFTNGIAPWAQDAAGDAKPVLVNDSLFGELNFEKIAELRPNLILGIYYTMTEDDYEILSKIAPTVGPSHFSTLRVVTEGRAVFSGMSLMHMAFNTNSPLSLPYWIDELIPRLAAAADGDPNTEVEPDDTTY